MSDTEVKSIRIVDRHTISVVERFQRANGITTATKAAAKMLERFDALESQSNHDRVNEAGTDAGKDTNASDPGNSKVA